MPRPRSRSSSTKSISYRTVAKKTAFSVSVVEPPVLTYLQNAPSVLISQCKHMRLAAQIAKVEQTKRIADANRTKQPRPRGLPGPAQALPLLEGLVTDQNMATVWESLGHALSNKSVKDKDLVFLAFWDAIRYAQAQCRAAIARRRDLEEAIREICQGLLRVGKAIATYWPVDDNREGEKRWPGVPSAVLWECLPDDLAASLEHWAPHMEYIAQQASEKAHTILVSRRTVDRNGYYWNVFVRLLQAKWPSDLSAQCTYDALSRIACVAFPDISISPRYVRDTLRPSPSRRSP